MLGLFRRTFKPTKEEQLHDLTLLYRLHGEQVGHCTTCLNYVSSEMPGFVTDFGSCKVYSDVFAAKVCGLIDSPCHFYKENKDEAADIKKKIVQLQQEVKEDKP